MQPAGGEIPAPLAGAAGFSRGGRRRLTGSNLRVLCWKTQSTWFSATTAFQALGREPTERAHDFMWGARSAGSPSALEAEI